MSDNFGSDFMTIVDEDGTEYEIEILSTLEYNGCTYMAAIPAGLDLDDSTDPEVFILKSIEDEDGEPLLCAIEDEAELEAVNSLIMEQLFEEAEDED